MSTLGYDYFGRRAGLNRCLIAPSPLACPALTEIDAFSSRIARFTQAPASRL